VVKQRRSTGRGFLLGLIVGLIVGAIVALIFTPPSGEGDYADVLRRRYGDAIEQSKDAYARARDDVLSRYSRAKAGDFSAE
jgi:gas vesicle protein